MVWLGVWRGGEGRHLANLIPLGLLAQFRVMFVGLAMLSVSGVREVRRVYHGSHLGSATALSGAHSKSVEQKPLHFQSTRERFRPISTPLKVVLNCLRRKNTRICRTFPSNKHVAVR